MKKLIFIFVLVLFGFKSHSQNCLGQSYSDVKKLMTDMGYIVNEGNSKKDGVKYITGNDELTYRIYFFSINNVCVSYVLHVREATFDVYERTLYDKGYLRLGDLYVKDDQIAQIYFSDLFKGYVVGMKFK